MQEAVVGAASASIVQAPPCPQQHAPQPHKCFHRLLQRVERLSDQLHVAICVQPLVVQQALNWRAALSQRLEAGQIQALLVLVDVAAEKTAVSNMAAVMTRDWQAAVTASQPQSAY